MALKLPEKGATPNKDPNVVPMIDILLVLLIIFMMQVPLRRQTMDVQVPPPTPPNQQRSSAPSNNIVLELKGDGSYAINGTAVPKNQLDAKFHEIFDNRPQKLMFLKSAPNRKYQEVIDAMDIARGAGVQVIGFTPPDNTPEEGQ